MVEHITHNPKSEGSNPVARTGGLYYKNVTIVNDATSWSVTLGVINYDPRVINITPR
jgi:hypothetical protein